MTRPDGPLLPGLLGAQRKGQGQALLNPAADATATSGRRRTCRRASSALQQDIACAERRHTGEPDLEIGVAIAIHIAFQ